MNAPEYELLVLMAKAIKSLVPSRDRHTHNELDRLIKAVEEQRPLAP